MAGATLYVQVTLTGSETAAQVATKTQIAVNSVLFAVPNLQGMFLRGTDPNNIWDLDLNNRWSIINNLNPALAGSFEFDQYTTHNHPGSTANVHAGTDYARSSSNSAYNSSAGSVTSILSINSDGGTETRPVNMYVKWLIRY